jgi:hypothetical protein
MFHELNKQIEEQTALIKELEKSYPKLDNSVGFYDAANTQWHIHHTELRDAYWRRRMLIAKRDGIDENETAKVY